MIITDTHDNSGIGHRFIEEIGDWTGIFRRDLTEISGDGYTANCFSDFASVTHVLRNNGEFGRFLQSKARGNTRVEIVAPLVSSADDRMGYRSHYYLSGTAEKGRVTLGIDDIPWSHKAFHLVFTPLLQGKMMKRFYWDTPKGNRIRVSDACGIDFSNDVYVSGVEELPHIIDVLFGLDGGFQSGLDRNIQTGLYSFGVNINNLHSEGRFRFEDNRYTGDYSSTVSLRTNAKYQTRDYLDQISGFVLP